ncbi:MAG: outer membrane lipoprotein-sorting protein [Candidatus Acidiferrales bacterium]
MSNRKNPFRVLRSKSALRFLLPSMAMLAIASLLPIASSAQTVDEVIAKNIQAHGGMDKLKSVNTIRTTGKLTAGQFRAGFLQENKRPDKVREETIIQGLAQVQGYDGKTGWQVNPFQGRRDAELLSADDLKSLQEDADIDGPLVDYKQKGHTAELLGHDSVEGTDCYKVKLKLKNGDVRIYFFDADSFLELKIETQSLIRGTVQYSEMFYGDYEQVNGLYYPFEFEQGQKGSADRVKFTVDKIEINIPLADSLFTMPAAPAAKPQAQAPGGAQ